MWLFLKYENVKGNLIKYKCLSSNNGYSIKLDEELEKEFKKTLINLFFC